MEETACQTRSSRKRACAVFVDLESQLWMRCVPAHTSSSFNGGHVSGKEDAANDSARVHQHMGQRVVDLRCLLLERLWVYDWENSEISDQLRGVGVSAGRSSGR